MDFAPYQDTSPDQQRALSPPRRDLSRSPPTHASAPRNIADSLSSSAHPSTNRSYNTAPSHQSLPDPSRFASASGFGSEDVEESAAGGGGGGLLGARAHVNLFETSLPVRLDYEAALAYVLLPPAGGVLLLLLEHKSDYVRFHAWQSSLVFSLVFVVHLVFSFSAVVSWILFVIDVVLIAVLARRAYIDADTLDRYEMPYFGPLASAWVDAE